MNDWDLDSPAKPARRGSPPSPSGEPTLGDRSGAEGETVVSSPPPIPAARTDGAGGPQPGPRQARRRFSYAWAGIAVVLLLAGLLGGYYIGRSQHAGDSVVLADANARLGELQKALTSSENRNWDYYREVQGLDAELEQFRSSTTTVTVPGGPRDSYSDGIYTVDKDISPGTYDGVVNGSLGYWARLRETDGAISSIVENGIPRGPFVLTIIPADKAVELRGVILTPR